MEETLVIIKPNGLKAGLIGEIIGRYEKARLGIRAMKAKHVSVAEAEGFYAEHKARPFFPELVQFMTSGPLVLIALKGENAISSARNINGATNPAQAQAGTIRHDFAPSITENMVHSSDSPESAKREVSFWFEENELVAYPIYSHVRS